MIRTDTLRIDPADAERLRHAFSDGGRSDAGGGREVVSVEDRVMLREGGGETEVAKPSRDGAPGKPSISDDGERLAYLRLDDKGGNRMEVTKCATGVLGGVRRLLSSSLVSTTGSIEGVDLAPSGDEIAYVTGNGAVHISPTLGGKGRNYYDVLPAIEGVQLGGGDIEFLPDGMVAVETAAKTYMLVDGGGHCQVISRAAFDPSGHAAGLAGLRERLPALTPEEAAWVAETFGEAAVGAYASEDGRALLLQVRQGKDTAQNFVLERKTGKRAAIGLGPIAPATWTNGLVGVEGGPSASLRSLFKGWDADLGQEELERRKAEIGEVVREDESIVVNGVRVPKRA